MRVRTIHRFTCFVRISNWIANALNQCTETADGPKRKTERYRPYFGMTYATSL